MTISHRVACDHESLQTLCTNQLNTSGWGCKLRGNKLQPAMAVTATPRQCTPDVGHASANDVEAARRLLRGRRVRRAAQRLSAAVCPGVGPYVPSKKRWATQVQQAAWPSYRAAKQQVSDDVRSVDEHVAKAARSAHPATIEGRELHPDAWAAVELIAKAGNKVAAAHERQWRVSLLRRVKTELAPVRRELERLQPAHIRRMPSQVDAALLAAASMAVGSPDSELALGFVVGFDAVGDIPVSGWWPVDPEPVQALFDLSAMPHNEANDSWHIRLEAALRTEAGDPVKREQARSVWARTQEELEKELCNGPFTKEQLDTAYGRGKWRAMKRFAVVQNGKVRACDNARASRHNEATTRHERMVNETADFPARAAAAFFARIGKPVQMLGGTDDIGAFYRRIPTATPQWCVVAVLNPQSGEVEYYTLPSFNFGLASAPNQCNRASEAGMRIARAFGVCCCKFFDDFNVSEPEYAAVSGQWALREIMALIGLPFDDGKAVGVKSCFVFLGVETDFGEGPCRTVRMRVRPDRVERLRQTLSALLAAGEMATAQASSLCGRLHFTLSWGFCRWGRAAMQPIYRRSTAPRSSGGAASRIDGPSEPLSAGERTSIKFFGAMLADLPPYNFEVDPDDEPPVLIWSDGASEPGSKREHTIGFVAALPRAGARPPPATETDAESVERVMRDYDVVHASAELDPEFIAHFVARKQQIGQVELVAALLPYLSLVDEHGRSRLAGKRCLHWIDNSSAVAALVKGYSGQPDSARIVHAVHATLAGLEARAWFEYVRTDANVADEPSRVDLSGRTYALGAAMASGLGERLSSRPIPAVLPDASRWDESGSDWMWRARSD